MINIRKFSVKISFAYFKKISRAFIIYTLFIIHNTDFKYNLRFIKTLFLHE